jgi:hypothetical protein
MGADMADINNDGKADVLLLICFQNKMKRLKTLLVLKAMIYFLEK